MDRNLPGSRCLPPRGFTSHTITQAPLGMISFLRIEDISFQGYKNSFPFLVNAAIRKPPTHPPGVRFFQQSWKRCLGKKSMAWRSAQSCGTGIVLE